MAGPPHLVIEPDAQCVARTAAQRIAVWAGQAIATRSRFSIALAGGSTPRATYQRLASGPNKDRIDWTRVHVFWGDERCVSPQDPDSNYGMAYASLLSKVPIPDQNVHRIQGEADAATAAQAYADELQSFFGADWPRFDLVLLGVGNDGHTASLFPSSAVLHERERAVVAVTADDQDRLACRVTLTVPAINTARVVMFLVTSGQKASMVQRVLEGPPGCFPAQFIRPVGGELYWLLDAAAASKLSAHILQNDMSGLPSCIESRSGFNVPIDVTRGTAAHPGPPDEHKRRGPKRRPD
jgi:6-phosphogluconolactonase